MHSKKKNIYSFQQAHEIWSLVYACVVFVHSTELQIFHSHYIQSTAFALKKDIQNIKQCKIELFLFKFQFKFVIRKTIYLFISEIERNSLFTFTSLALYIVQTSNQLIVPKKRAMTTSLNWIKKKDIFIATNLF